MAHGPSSHRLWQGLMGTLNCILLKYFSKFAYLQGTLFNESVEVQVPIVHYYLIILLIKLKLHHRILFKVSARDSLRFSLRLSLTSC